MQKDTSRSAYTRRIMEILVNIQKQKEDIGKVIKLILLSHTDLHTLFPDFRRYSTGTKGN